MKGTRGARPLPPPRWPATCVLQSATLRLYAAGEAGRSRQALPAAPWQETHVTWLDQPTTSGTPATATSGAGYREWNVTAPVAAMLAGRARYGCLIRDAAEGSAGAEQQFHRREKGESPPQLVLPFAPASP
jgi:hypothetical protein